MLLDVAGGKPGGAARRSDRTRARERVRLDPIGESAAFDDKHDLSAPIEIWGFEGDATRPGRHGADLRERGHFAPAPDIRRDAESRRA